jgi:catechol 2,3-dioxygenase-like lactoylglutathione lyase family enzyme
MLSQRRCWASIPTSDLDRAKKWYSEMLGLEPTMEDPGGAMYPCAEGTGFGVYLSQFAGTGKQTVMGWDTPDIEADVKELKDRGVTFEAYDMPDIKTDGNGIAQLGPSGKGAWFKDADGNILALFQWAQA